MQYSIGERDGAYGEHDPDKHDDPGGEPVPGLAGRHDSRSLLATLGHDLGGDDLEEEGDAQRDEDQVVQVAEDGDEVGDEVDRAERVPDDAGRQRPAVSGRAGIPAGQVERVCLSLQPLRPVFPCGPEAHTSLLSVTLYARMKRSAVQADRVLALAPSRGNTVTVPVIICVSPRTPPPSTYTRDGSVLLEGNIRRAYSESPASPVAVAKPRLQDCVPQRVLSLRGC